MLRVELHTAFEIPGSKMAVRRVAYSVAARHIGVAKWLQQLAEECARIKQCTVTAIVILSFAHLVCCIGMWGQFLK